MRRSAFLAAAVLAGCARRPGAAPGAIVTPGAPVHIIALGDSLPFGTGASSPANGFIFRAYLRVRGAHPGSRIDSYAMGGSTAADVLRLQVPRLAPPRGGGGGG